MLDIPQPKLGQITAFTITTPDLKQSLSFYQQLGFTEVIRADWPFPWIQVSDGAVLMMLRKDNDPYLALTYYVQDIDGIVAELDALNIAFTFRAKPTDMLKRYIIQSPDGLNVSLVGIIEGFQQPVGPTMLKMNQQDYFNPEKYVNKVCGMFGELAHPVKDLDESLKFWEQLGFKAISRFTSPYPWAIATDGLAVVGLHQSNHFSFPAITYFAADMKDKIVALKANGITGAEQGPSNMVLTTPEQQHIFLYKLGM